jgi:predicted Zn finger-like uncharacterized protein
MKVVCPSCGADYRVNEEKVPADGQAINCPSCQTTFLVYQDGTTASDAEVSQAKSVPPPLPPSPLSGEVPLPPPPPPPGDIEDMLAPLDIDDLSADIDVADEPTFMGGDAVPQPPSMPVDELAPPSPLDLDGDPFASKADPEVDDFDFSFGASESMAPQVQEAASSPLGDLFDDLDDLPAPKPQQIPQEFTDLPAPRGASASADLGDIDDLPGLRRDAPATESAPVETDQETGLMAPDAKGVPSLPDDDDAHFYAQTGAQPTAPDPGVAQEEAQGRVKLLGFLLGAVILGGAIGGLMIAEIGPFAPDEKPQVRRKKVKLRKVVPPTKAIDQTSDKSQATPSDKPTNGLIQTQQATLAEIDGYRSAIGGLEQKKANLDSAQKAQLVELYALGVMEYPENQRWLQSGIELVKSLDEKDGSLAMRRARLAVALADGVNTAPEKVEALAKSSPRDALVLRLLGHSRRITMQKERAFNAFRRAYARDKGLLGAQRQAGVLALAMGKVDAAKNIFEDLYTKAPGAPNVNTSLAAIMVRKGQTDRAKKLLLQALTLDSGRARPQDRSAAFVVRARISQGEGKQVDAIEDLRSAVRAWPGNLEALDMLSAEQFKAKRFDEALDVFVALEKAGARSAATAIKIGQCFGSMGRPKRAISHLTDATVKYPESADLQIELGDVHLGQQDFQLARAAYEASLKVIPNYDRAQLKIAELLVKEAKVDEALAFLEAGLKKNPKADLMHYGLANLKKQIASTSGEVNILAEAETAYKKALQLNPGLVDARRNLVSVLVESGKAAEGLKELEHLMQRTDFHDDMSYELGRANQALGRLDEAAKHYEKALKREPSNSRFLKFAGENSFARKQYETAKKLLVQAIKLDPKDIDVHYYLGRIAYINTNYQVAIQRFKQGLGLNKRNHVIRYWLGRALQATKTTDQVKASRVQYDRVSAAVVKQPSLESQLCDVFYRRGQMQMEKYKEWQEGIIEFGRYLKCNPKNAQAWYFRGVLKEKVTDLKGAIQDFQKAIKLNSKLGKAYSEQAKAQMRLPKYKERQVRLLLKSALKYDKTLSYPHFILCNMEKERNRGAARRHCQAYLKMAPTGDYSDEAKELLRSL